MLFTQSGLQTVYGGASLSPALESFREEMEKKAEKEPGGKGAEKAKPEKDGPDIAPAPWLAAFPILLLLGIVFGLADRAGSVPRVGVAVCVGAALLMLVVQMGVGFPVERDIGKKAAQDAGKKKDDPDIGAAVAIAFEVRYTPWLWITVGAVMTAAALALVEQVAAGPEKGYSRYPAYPP